MLHDTTWNHDLSIEKGEKDRAGQKEKEVISLVT